MEQRHRGERRGRAPWRHRRGARRPRHRLREPRGRLGDAAARDHRHRRVRSRARRRPRLRLGRPRRRGSRHRQVDAAATGGRGARAHAARGLCLGRGGDRPGAAARRAARADQGAGRAGLDDLRARRARQPRGQGRARRHRHRFDPDDVRRHARLRAGHRVPGPCLGERAHPHRQEARRRDPAGRPRDQGRHDRGPARARAHGRHRALLRGRARPPVPHHARGQEQVRPDRRDRRLRDDRPRPGRGPEPIAALPRGPPRRRLGRRGLRWDGGHAAGPRRDPGAGRPAGPGNRAPRRDRLGRQQAGDGARGAGDPLRPGLRQPRRLPERRRGPPDRRAGSRPRGRRRARLGPERPAGPARRGRLRRDRAGRRGARGPSGRRRGKPGDGAITVVAIDDLGSLVAQLSGGRSGARASREKSETAS